MASLENNVAIVTGAGQGIGEAIALRFGREGARVVLGDINEARGQAIAAAIRAGGGAAEFVRCDVSQPAEVDGLVDRAMAMFGGVDILVNNAAIAIYRDLPDYTPEEWDQVLAVNLRGIFLASRRCMPIMAARGGGSIVHIASVHARITATGNAPYVASKGAVVSLTRAMALEGAPHKIRVNCILPGAIATPMLLENWGDVAPEQHPLLPRIPLGRFGAPDEIARVAQFLASDESSYMTGSDVLVDGGISAHFT
ncbi:MAG TPA: SDR family NAD(P)-dependent oxidoreductase [Roseiflexaceae bacterium]|nr:SDR family NAD(P)-dependent oxidoreductase [Roseiflexaceae bacterium]